MSPSGGSLEDQIIKRNMNNRGASCEIIGWNEDSIMSCVIPIIFS